jgi:hypothetical protein
MKGGRFQFLEKMDHEFVETFRRYPQHKFTDHFLAKDETLKILIIAAARKHILFRDSSVGHGMAPTRHSILLFIAKPYDALGWAAPVVIVAKILLQELWLLNDNWNAPIPQDLVQHWLDYIDNLSHCPYSMLDWLVQRKSIVRDVRICRYIESCLCCPVFESDSLFD